MESTELKKILETLLFITDSPLGIKKLSAITEEREEIIRDHLASLCNDYENEKRPLQIRQIGGGWQMSTRPEYGQWVRKLYNNKMTARLTQAALETLCIVAYRQPLTRSEIEAIRGVDSSGPIDTLVQRRLIYISGRKEIPGRPMLYATTPEFLRQFGLASLKDLPKLETFSIDSSDMEVQGIAAQMADNALKDKNPAARIMPTPDENVQQLEMFPTENDKNDEENPAEEGDNA